MHATSECRQVGIIPASSQGRAGLPDAMGSRPDAGTVPPVNPGGLLSIRQAFALLPVPREGE